MSHLPDDPSPTSQKSCFYRDYGSNDVSNLAQAICRERGENPFDLVADSGYHDAAMIPRWWKHQDFALRFLACHDYIHSHDAALKPNAAMAVGDDRIVQLLEKLADTARRAGEGSLTRHVSLLAIGTLAGSRAFFSEIDGEDAGALQSCLMAAYAILRNDPSVAAVREAADTIERGIDRLARARDLCRTRDGETVSPEVNPC